MDDFFSASLKPWLLNNLSSKIITTDGWMEMVRNLWGSSVDHLERAKQFDFQASKTTHRQYSYTY
jgi:hypothetical protein